MANAREYLAQVKNRNMALLLILAFLLSFVAPAAADAVTVCNAVWRDAARSRDIPVRIRMPDGSGQIPIILFSHGLGGSLESGTDWTSAWAEAGFATLTLDHPGSDRQLRGDSISAAGLSAQLEARVADVRFALDELARRAREGGCDLRRVDLSRVGMSGHSFGAITTQALSGQSYPLPSLSHAADPRIRAAIAFSPSPPMRGHDDAAAFAGIHIPFLSVTGTADFAPITPQVSAADRQRPFRAMPPGDKYLLVVGGANHLQFNGQDGLRRDTEPGEHMRAIVIAATTAFWNASLRGDSSARNWFYDMSGLRKMLAASDRFEAR
jgi:predicted dienelactone hydrolase